MKEFRITFWKFILPSIKIGLLLILFIFLMLLLMFAVYHKFGYVPSFLVIITVSWLLLLSIPNIVLHINYCKHDKKKKIKIDFKKEKIIITKDRQERAFLFKDVLKVEKIGTNPSTSYNFHTIAAWKYFYFYRIELLDSSSIYITRLLIQNLEKVLPTLPYEYLYRSYPLIKNL